MRTALCALFLVLTACDTGRLQLQEDDDVAEIAAQVEALRAELDEVTDRLEQLEAAPTSQPEGCDVSDPVLLYGGGENVQLFGACARSVTLVELGLDREVTASHPMYRTGVDSWATAFRGSPAHYRIVVELEGGAGTMCLPYDCAASIAIDVRDPTAFL